ncbi:hypothetical protein QWU01_15510, partial [Kluyvera cryocrescens]
MIYDHSRKIDNWQKWAVERMRRCTLWRGARLFLLAQFYMPVSCPWSAKLRLAFQPVALLIHLAPYKPNGARSAQGAANRRRPLHPRALAAESPL